MSRMATVHQISASGGGVPKTPLDRAEIDIDGTIYLGVKEMTFTQSREPGIIRGSGSAQKLARTRGEYDCEGSVVMWHTQAHELIAALAAKGAAEGLGWMEVSFNITFNVTSQGITSHTNKLFGCNLISDEGGGSQGTDPLERSFDLDIMYVEVDGVRAIGGPLV